jgi:hypothetical protein
VIPSFAWLRRLIFGIHRRQWIFAYRGFHQGDPTVRQHLERIIGCFVNGYHTTLEDGRLETLAARLDTVEPEYRGFGYEGAGLCLALFDLLTPWKRNRWETFVKGTGAHQSFLLHVGYGLLLGRLGRPAELALTKLTHPGERWLAVDGYGFYQGYFHWDRYVRQRAEPPPLHGFARRVFDQGLGRCLWFGCCADVELCARTVASFPSQRHDDLWSGLGVACTFAGGVGPEAIARLAELAGPFQGSLRLGTVLAAKLRHHAGIVVEHTERALDVLCGLSPDAAVAMVDAVFGDPPPDGAEPAYQVLRRCLQQQLVSTEELKA